MIIPSVEQHSPPPLPPPPQQGKREKTTTVPYWIPKEVFCSSSTSSNSNEKQQGVKNTASNNKDDRGDDQSSVMSLSTTSELTIQSAIADNPSSSTTSVPKNNIKDETIRKEIHNYAIETAYNDLEYQPTEEDWLPSSSSQGIFETSEPFPFMTIEQVQDDVVEGDNDDDDDDDDEPFDPFFLGHSSCPSFSEFYKNNNNNENFDDDNNFCFKKESNTDKHQLLDITPSFTVSNEAFLFPEDPMENDDFTNNPTPRSSRTIRRRHSDYGPYVIKKKQRILIPLHTRMEMIGHQSQKPFRTVSKIIVGSIQRLNDMIRPGFPPDTRMLSTRNRFSIFRRRSNKNLLISSSMDDDADDGSLSSLPDLRNVTSLGSSESDSLFLQHQSRTSPLGGMAVGDADPEVLLFPNSSITGVNTKNNAGEDDDFRWLFARQQLPPSTAAQFSPSFKEKIVPSVNDIRENEQSATQSITERIQIQTSYHRGI